ncbi:MAG: intradiol ring-cleavage dioxygenase [Thermomicrobiales bacterium]
MASTTLSNDDPRAEHADGKPATASRRTILKAGAALGLGAAGMGALAHSDGATAATPAATACVLTPELTDGPFYLPDELIRKDITEGKAGLPLRLRILVNDPTACTPLANAAVDLWHCDAQGYYSGVTGENPGSGATIAAAASSTFMRGIQLTGADGIAEFMTVYPGWYAGRAIHIHLKVHVDGAAGAVDGGTPAAGGSTYTGGHVSHTGQLFFDDTLSDEVFKLDAYAGRTGSRLLNSGDGILGAHAEEPGFLLDITQVTAGKLADGLVGTITLGVDPTVTQSAQGGGFGGPPPGGGNGGPPNGTPPAGA